MRFRVRGGGVLGAHAKACVILRPLLVPLVFEQSSTVLHNV